MRRRSLILGRTHRVALLAMFLGASALVALGTFAAILFPAVLLPTRVLLTPTSTTTVVIHAYDSLDPYVRDWALTIDRPMPPPQGSMGYVGGDAYETHVSGSTMTFSKTLSSGSHYLVFIIGQTGGPSYGTYSGTITVNGQVYEFSGVDDTHSATINFST
jgi:hypothetical protein